MADTKRTCLIFHIWRLTNHRAASGQRSVDTYTCQRCGETKEVTR